MWNMWDNVTSRGDAGKMWGAGSLRALVNIGCAVFSQLHGGTFLIKEFNKCVTVLHFR
jgi:hypothetical protein